MAKIPVLPKKVREQMQATIDNQLVVHGIEVEKITTGNSGRAYRKRRVIAIPKPTTVRKFCIALHEIGHIVLGFTRPIYWNEYRVERYAIDMATALGYDIGNYEMLAKGYVLSKIAKGFNRMEGKGGGRKYLESIKPEVSQWLGVDFEDWNHNRVFVHRYNEQYEVILTPLF